MAPHPKSPNSAALLVGFLLILIAGLMCSAFVPIGHCRSCKIEIAVRAGEATDSLGLPPEPHVCSHCNGKGRVTLIRMWLVDCPYLRIQSDGGHPTNDDCATLRQEVGVNGGKVRSVSNIPTHSLE